MGMGGTRGVEPTHVDNLETGIEGGKWFSLIDHGKLMEEVERKISDGRLLGLIGRFLKAGVMESMKGWEATEKTGRSEGRSMREICEDLNRTLRGWFEYFKHSNRYTFEGVDKYVRGRLRSILRRRKGLTGRGRGRDHQRWRNSYFTAQGLMSLLQAFVAAGQSRCRA